MEHTIKEIKIFFHRLFLTKKQKAYLKRLDCRTLFEGKTKLLSVKKPFTLSLLLELAYINKCGIIELKEEQNIDNFPKLTVYVKNERDKKIIEEILHDNLGCMYQREVIIKK